MFYFTVLNMTYYDLEEHFRLVSVESQVTELIDYQQIYFAEALLKLG